MLSTMVPSLLTVEQILRYAVDVDGDRTVTTATREAFERSPTVNLATKRHVLRR